MNGPQTLTRYLADVPPSRRRACVDKPGAPRCTTHSRTKKKTSGATQHDAYVQRVYGLKPGDYQRLYEFQNGRCYLCQRAKGYSRRLAVDHDHETGLVYGLLCSRCNKDVLGHSRREIAYFERAKDYLVNPPARQLRIVAYHQDNREKGTDA